MHATNHKQAKCTRCLANVRRISTLTCLHELTLTPKHLRERASTAGERLLHGWASGMKTLLLWNALKVSFNTRVVFCFFLFLSWFASEVSSRPLPTPCTVVIFALFSFLSADCRSVARLDASYATESCPLLFGWWEISLLHLLSARSLKLQCGAASDGEHSVNKARERDRAMRKSRSLLQSEDRLYPSEKKWEHWSLCMHRCM